MIRRIVMVAFLAAACTTDQTPMPTAGTLTLALAGAGNTDGAIVLLVSGGPVVSVAVSNGYQVATNADGAGTHVMVLGSLSSGTLATINVPDMSRASSYVVSVVQVSDRNSFGLLDPVGYHVSVHP